MRLKFILKTAFLSIGLAAGLVTLGGAAADAQTSVAASLYGAFTGTTTGNGVQQSPSNSAGGLSELRHIKNPIIGYEATYSYNRANQVYSLFGANCGVICAPPPPAAAISANAHEITGDWVASVKVAQFRPFALAGAGLLLDVPVGGSSTSTSTKPVYVYGGGVDWGILPHLGLRFQYRGNLYEAPDLTKLYTSSKAFTHNAEPMIGAYFRL
jgi:opacity protein-like surface antigen